MVVNNRISLSTVFSGRDMDEKAGLYGGVVDGVNYYIQCTVSMSQFEHSEAQVEMMYV